MCSPLLTTRRRILGILLACTVLMSACGGDGEAEGDTGSSPSSDTDVDEVGAPERDAGDTTPTESTTTVTPSVDQGVSPSEAPFPVTIEHGLGATTIEETPRRIVTLGAAEADALLAIGVTPVAVAGIPTAPDGLRPWWDGGGDLADATVLLSDFTGVFDLEEIAALEPDLILAMGAAIDGDSYALMSEIAPTVPYLTAPFQDPWQDVTTVVGTAVGLPTEGTALVAEVEAVMAGTAATPGIEGASYTFNVLPAPGVVVSVTEPADSANRFLADLGMAIADGVADLPRDPTTGSTISEEQLDLLDADVVLFFAATEDAATAFLDAPTFAGTPAAVDGRVIQLDLDQAVAIRSPGALAIPWLLADLEQPLAEALG